MFPVFSSFLYLIDRFGRPVTINFSGRDKFKSKFGGVCTLLFLGYIAWVLITSSSDLFSKTNPNTVTSQTYMEDPRELIFSSQTFPAGIGIQAPVGMNLTPFINEAIYTVDFYYVMRRKTVSADGTLRETINRTLLEKEICTPEHFGEQAEAYAKLQLNTTYCIAKEQSKIKSLRIQGVYASPLMENIAVFVKICNNVTTGGKCATPEVIDQYLSGGWFNVLHAGMTIDPKNYSRPDTKYRDVFGTMISPANYKEITFLLGHVNVNTDSGWLVSDVETKHYIKVDKINEALQFKPDTRGVLCLCLFQVSQIESHYSRSYKTIQDVLAQAGGLANVGLIVILIVTTPYLNLKFRLSLINELFDIHPLSADNKKNKKKKGSSKKQRGSETVSMRNQSGRDNEKDGQGMLTNKGDDDRIEIAKSNPTHESLFTVSARFSPLSSNRLELPVNPERDSSPVRNKNEVLSLQSGYYPLQVNTPKSGTEEKVIPVAKNSSLSKFEEVVSQPVKGVETTKVSSLKTSHIEHELPKIRKTKSKISLYAKKKLEQIDQKNINDTNDDFPNIFDSEGEEVSQNDIENIPSKIVKSINFPNAKMFERNIAVGEGEANKIEASDIQAKSDVQSDIENTSRPPNEVEVTDRKPYKLTLTLGEYISSFFWTSPALKQKMDILSEGIRNIDTRLDVISIMKKLREIDKLKAMLLDLDQAVLFNNLPKPEIKPKALKRMNGSVSFSHNLLRKSTFIEKDQGEGYNVHIENLEGKAKKTKMDQRLIAIFKEKKV